MPNRPRGKRVRGVDGSFMVSGKAANGEGSLYREVDGVWRATYRVPGESRPRRMRGRTREEALRRRAEALTRALAEGPRSPAYDRAERIEHDRRAGVGGCRPWRPYGCGRRRWGSTSIGSSGSRRGSATCGSGAYGRAGGDVAVRAARSLAAKTVADIRATFRSIVDEAVNLGLVATNPVDRVRPPKRRAADRKTSAHRVRGPIGRGGQYRGSLWARPSPCCSYRAGGCPRSLAWPGRISISRLVRRPCPERASTPTASG